MLSGVLCYLALYMELANIDIETGKDFEGEFLASTDDPEDAHGLQQADFRTNW